MKKRNLAFTVELLGLFILLIMVITVITQVFVMSRSHSLEAKQLTEAVILAENTAELISTEQDVQKLSDKLLGMDNVSATGLAPSFRTDSAGGTIWAGAAFDGDSGAADYEYVIEVSRRSSRSGKGIYAEDVINVYNTDEVISYTSDQISAAGPDCDRSTIIESLAAAGDLQTDGALTEDGSTEGISLPEPVYSLTAGKYFGEDK